MTGDSWASYRAAAPPEVFGEPDDPVQAEWLTRELRIYPTCYVVEWYATELCSDGQEHIVRTFRHFDASALGCEVLAYQAADRWRKAMAVRHGSGNVRLGLEGLGDV